MTDTYDVQQRAITGKAVRKLRRQGVLPASIYGRGLQSVAVQLPYIAARDLMNAHGMNSLVSIKVEGESDARPVVVRKVDQDPVTRELRHLDFYQVDLRRKITGAVPLHYVGEAPVAHDLGGVLVHQADSIEVEALPADMPDAIEVSVESLVDFDSRLTTADVRAPRGVTVIAEAETILVSVTRPRVEQEEAAALVEGAQPEAAAEAVAAAEAEAAEGDSAAGEPAATSDAEGSSS